MLIDVTGLYRLFTVTHEYANRLVTLLDEQVRSDAAVNATRHGKHHSRHYCNHLKKYKEESLLPRAAQPP